jgi:hypothetical protein
MVMLEKIERSNYGKLTILGEKSLKEVLLIPEEEVVF